MREFVRALVVREYNAMETGFAAIVDNRIAPHVEAM